MITKRRIMDFFTGVAAIIAALGGVIIALPPAITAVSNFQVSLRKTRMDEAKAKLEEEKERAELADKLGVSKDQSLNKLVTIFVERLDKENTVLKETLETNKQERDKQIHDLQEGQKKSDELQTRMAEEMEILRTESERKDKVIEGQGKRIVKLEGKLKRLEQHIKENGLSLPDDWEHEEESGG